MRIIEALPRSGEQKPSIQALNEKMLARARLRHAWNLAGIKAEGVKESDSEEKFVFVIEGDAAYLFSRYSMEAGKLTEYTIIDERNERQRIVHNTLEGVSCVEFPDISSKIIDLQGLTEQATACKLITKANPGFDVKTDPPKSKTT